MKCAHVEPVGAAGARALLLGEPDFFLGDVGELVELRDGSAGACRRPVEAHAADQAVDPLQANHAWPRFDSSAGSVCGHARSIRGRAASVNVAAAGQLNRHGPTNQSQIPAPDSDQGNALVEPTGRALEPERDRSRSIRANVGHAGIRSRFAAPDKPDYQALIEVAWALRPTLRIGENTLLGAGGLIRNADIETDTIGRRPIFVE